MNDAVIANVYCGYYHCFCCYYFGDVVTVATTLSSMHVEAHLFSQLAKYLLFAACLRLSSTAKT